jgi:50S ribosomal protein L16 3-hydroxylase
MFEAWLSPLSVEEFVRGHFGRAPHARPSAAASALPLFNWAVLERIFITCARTQLPPDVWVAANGRLVEVPPPRCTSDVRRLMRERYGVVIRKAERHYAPLAELALAFARDLRGEVHIQLYVTPAGTQTFGWHYDDEDVFIAQTLGTKDYYLRQNTVAVEQSARGSVDFSALRRETSPLSCARLIAGDWLYIPARWWHLVRSVEDALSISIGVTPEQSGQIRRPGSARGPRHGRTQHGVDPGRPSNERAPGTSATSVLENERHSDNRK